MKRFLGWLALDHRSLGHQPLFWVAIFLPVTLFIVFGCISWIGSSPQWDYEGFNHFIDRSKLPLGLLALALPFTALVTSWHRSIQTAKQIKETQVKNTADLYYAHLKFFIEQLEDNRLVLSPIALHREIYPLLTKESYNTTICAQKKDLIKKAYQEFSNIITQAENGKIHHSDYLKKARQSIQSTGFLATFFINEEIFKNKSNNNDFASSYASFGKLNKELEKIKDLISM